MAEPTDMLAREIDEELRRERLLQFWDQYGTYILAMALAVWSASVATSSMKVAVRRPTWRPAPATSSGCGISRMNKPGEAQKALENLAANAPAAMRRSAACAWPVYDQGSGNLAEATSAYEDIAKDGNVDPILADYARLQIAMLKLDRRRLYGSARIGSRLLPADKNPWRFSARELLGLAAYKAGLAAEARNHFQRLITDRTAPPGIAERARTMLAVMAQSEQAAAPAAATEKSDPSAKQEPAKEQKPPAKTQGNKAK